MLEDLHDPRADPIDREPEWIAADAVETVARAVILAAVALAIGWGASVLVESGLGLPPVTSAAAR